MKKKKEIDYKVTFELLLDEINENIIRATTMLSSDLDLPTMRFFEGQIIVLNRVLNSVDYED